MFSNRMPTHGINLGFWDMTTRQPLVLLVDDEQDLCMLMQNEPFTLWG